MPLKNKTKQNKQKKMESSSDLWILPVYIFTYGTALCVQSSLEGQTLHQLLCQYDLYTKKKAVLKNEECIPL